MNIKQFFHRKRRAQQQEPQPLRIEGIGPAPLTPEPDEAELAAQALLEHMAEVSSFKFQVSSSKFKVSSFKFQVSSERPETRNLKPETRNQKPETRNLKPETRGNAAMKPETRDAKYYRDLAARIRSAHEAATQRTLRFVAFCEQELQKPSLPISGPGSLGLLETELYKRLDVIERRGGELKRRWQHCLAMVIVRIMQHSENTTTDDTDSTEKT